MKNLWKAYKRLASFVHAGSDGRSRTRSLASPERDTGERQPRRAVVYCIRESTIEQCSGANITHELFWSQSSLRSPQSQLASIWIHAPLVLLGHKAQVSHHSYSTRLVRHKRSLRRSRHNFHLLDRLFPDHTPFRPYCHSSNVSRMYSRFHSSGYIRLAEVCFQQLREGAYLVFVDASTFYRHVAAASDGRSRNSWNQKGHWVARGMFVDCSVLICSTACSLMFQLLRTYGLNAANMDTGRTYLSPLRISVQATSMTIRSGLTRNSPIGLFLFNRWCRQEGFAQLHEDRTKRRYSKHHFCPAG